MSGGLSLNTTYGATTYAPTIPTTSSGAARFKQQVAAEFDRTGERATESGELSSFQSNVSSRSSDVAKTAESGVTTRSVEPARSSTQLLDQLREQLASSRLLSSPLPEGNAFSSIDSDGNGKVSSQEINAVLRQRAEAPNPNAALGDGFNRLFASMAQQYSQVQTPAATTATQFTTQV